MRVTLEMGTGTFVVHHVKDPIISPALNTTGIVLTNFGKNS
jgi:hypothetical protein